MECCIGSAALRLDDPEDIKYSLGHAWKERTIIAAGVPRTEVLAKAISLLKRDFADCRPIILMSDQRTGILWHWGGTRAVASNEDVWQMWKKRLRQAWWSLRPPFVPIRSGWLDGTSPYGTFLGCPVYVTPHIADDQILLCHDTNKTVAAKIVCV